ncbi:hypothetical protein TNCV_3555721 [Trichonephila clavipes]|nr:hypothetical protein TNCV_3555721 [Trichonephila clavipes]
MGNKAELLQTVFIRCDSDSDVLESRAGAQRGIHRIGTVKGSPMVAVGPFTLELHPVRGRSRGSFTVSKVAGAIPKDKIAHYFKGASVHKDMVIQSTKSQFVTGYVTVSRKS